MINRNTIQCSMVLEAVNKLKCHATAVEVYDEVVRVCPHIKIRKIEIPGAADRFDHRCQEHYHILCETCGRVFDVDMDVFEDLYQKIRDTHGFEFTGCDIMFRGICPECK